MFSVNYIFLLNITYAFAIITCLGFLVFLDSFVERLRSGRGGQHANSQELHNASARAQLVCGKGVKFRKTLTN